jgi:hypothetical protein
MSAVGLGADSLDPLLKNGTAIWDGDLTKTLVQNLQAVPSAHSSPSAGQREML